MSFGRLSVWRMLAVIVFTVVGALGVPAILRAQGGGEGDSVNDAKGSVGIRSKQFPPFP